MQLSYQSEVLEAGLDEAGRGCLAGGVFAAAVILPPDFHHPLLNDSKQVSERNRYVLREIIEREALAWAVAEVDAKRIDEINILNASFEAMNIAASKLSVRPELLLVDGHMFRTESQIAYKCMVKGDAKFMNIAAASILAKTYRDDAMNKLDALHPQYAWKKNKGYPTKAHKQAIAEYGITPYHRLSYAGVK